MTVVADGPCDEQAAGRLLSQRDPTSVDAARQSGGQSTSTRARTVGNQGNHVRGPTSCFTTRSIGMFENLLADHNFVPVLIQEIERCGRESGLAWPFVPTRPCSARTMVRRAPSAKKTAVRQLERMPTVLSSTGVRVSRAVLSANGMPSASGIGQIGGTSKSRQGRQGAGVSPRANSRFLLTFGTERDASKERRCANAV